jgi:catechol 2,3-dioxygenase-like lactoylglutathione lyase family enzyme
MTKLSTIGQIPMVVKDVPRAVSFYRDTLGMRVLFQAPPAYRKECSTPQASH